MKPNLIFSGGNKQSVKRYGRKIKTVKLSLCGKCPFFRNISVHLGEIQHEYKSSNIFFESCIRKWHLKAQFVIHDVKK